MPTINKTEYTKFVDASAETFTAQCNSASGWIVQFGASQPELAVAGTHVPGGFQYGVTRANGTSHGWGKLPAGAAETTAEVVVLT
jgi:hypothetical protein